MKFGTSSVIATVRAAVINRLTIMSAAKLIVIGLDWAGFAVLAR